MKKALPHHNKNLKTPDNFTALCAPFLNHPKFLKMKNYYQHASTTTYDHCISVAKLSYSLNKTLHLGANEKDLVTAALLHDFFLYDWHDPNNPTKRRLKLDSKTKHRQNPSFIIRLKTLKSAHAFSHPNTACKNALKYFHINQPVQLAIKSHMWPLNFTCFPKSRIALLISFTDKICTLREFFRH